MSLIERFYDPQMGSVTLDDIDIKTLNLSWYRQQIALVGQVWISSTDVLVACSFFGNCSSLENPLVWGGDVRAK